MFIKRLKILFIVFWISFSAKSQNSDLFKNTFLEVDYGYGFILPHHEFIRYTLEDHIRTFDLKLTKSTYGEKYWNQLYRYPNYGIGFYRSNLGNNDVFGNANALYAFTKVPIFGESDKINLSWQIAFGASYITKRFDIEENPQDLAIGSHLDIFLDFSLQSKILLTERLALTNGIRFTHFSNGKVKPPNTGLNIISGSLGLTYQLSKTRSEKIQVELPQIEDKTEYTLIYAAGIKSISRYEQGSYYASSLIFDYNRNYSLKGRWVFGADLFYDETSSQFSENNDKSRLTNVDLYQLGLHVGHETIMGKLSLVVNVGGYIYAPVEVEAPIYSRIGLRYRIKDHFIINYTLKAHWAMASFIEWGFGYVF